MQEVQDISTSVMAIIGAGGGGGGLALWMIKNWVSNINKRIKVLEDRANERDTKLELLIAKVTSVLDSVNKMESKQEHISDDNQEIKIALAKLTVN